MQEHTQMSDTVGVSMHNDHDRPPRRFSSGRMCMELGCGTHLSVYNNGSRCSLHHLCVAPRMRGRKQKA
jgi:hypothetical protein